MRFHFLDEVRTISRACGSDVPGWCPAGRGLTKMKRSTWRRRRRRPRRRAWSTTSAPTTSSRVFSWGKWTPARWCARVTLCALGRHDTDDNHARRSISGGGWRAATQIWPAITSRPSCTWALAATPPRPPRSGSRSEPVGIDGCPIPAPNPSACRRDPARRVGGCWARSWGSSRTGRASWRRPRSRAAGPCSTCRCTTWREPRWASRPW